MEDTGVEGPHTGAGEKHDEKGATERASDPSAHLPGSLAREDGDKIGSKAEPRKKEGWEKGVLRCGFISHYPTLAINSITFPKSSLLCL